MENKDILISIFENLINDSSFPNENDADFIDRVTFHYLHHLNTKGHIPYIHFHLVKQDILEEVTEIYRKKTYGHFSLKSYRKNKK
ncbi:MAG TPA: DNA-dependent DNA polymerase [Pseudobdellovibrionaceae bacterium]|nr:DNA-dependent DNA polymerase [Pseudobdellovibrionaceae bacterium]